MCLVCNCLLISCVRARANIENDLIILAGNTQPMKDYENMRFKSLSFGVCAEFDQHAKLNVVNVFYSLRIPLVD